MRVLNEEGRKPIKAWVDGVQFEEEAQKQVENVASLPFVFKHVAVMPDVHWGIGATVGSVIATKGAIVPAAVGVDIGCGMRAVRTNLKASDLPDNLAPLRSTIEAAVPHGRTDNGGANDRGAWGSVPDNVLNAWCDSGLGLGDAYNEMAERRPQMTTRRLEAGLHQLGTLGTGNHFVEVCLDEKQNVWIVLHSGSRGVGNKIGTYFIERAREEMKRWFIDLPDPDLAYLPERSGLFDEYLEAVEWAQKYALTNRSLMMRAVFAALVRTVNRPELIGINEEIDCHHNYVARENHFGENVLVTRKGAVRARAGDLGIIPGSMGARSYIVRGLGNADSFQSCSHGAGRAMSRGEAKRRFTVDDHKKATEGVECRKDADVVDETPAAYKSIDAVMEAQRDLVEVVHTLKQVVCVKG